MLSAVHEKLLLILIGHQTGTGQSKMKPLYADCGGNFFEEIVDNTAKAAGGE